MLRTARMMPGGYVFDVLHRAVGRMTLFDKPADYEAFEAVLDAALVRVPGVSLLSYCLMPQHWHLVLRPAVRAMAEFMQARKTYPSRFCPFSAFGRTQARRLWH